MRTVAMLAVVVVLVGTVGCDGGGASSADVSVRHVAVRSDVTLSNVTQINGTLVGTDYRDAYNSFIVASRDLGRTWRRVALPGAPGTVRDTLIAQPVGNVLAVVARRHSPLPGHGNIDFANGPTWVWTTTDGLEWQGGQLVPDSLALGVPAVSAIGRVLLVGATVGSSFVVYRSVDNGLSWTSSKVAGVKLSGVGDARATLPVLESVWTRGTEWVGSLGTAGPLLVSRDRGVSWFRETCRLEDCVRPLVAGRLQVRMANARQEASTDGGRRWRALTALHGRQLTLDYIVVLDDGDWLAAGYSWRRGGLATAELVRSRDGVRWERLVGGLCGQIDNERDTGFREPVRLGASWLVTYTCLTPRGTGVRYYTRLYRVSRDAHEASAIDAARLRGKSFGDPVAVDNQALLPVGNDGIEAFEALTLH